jgi:hypothetical protein
MMPVSEGGHSLTVSRSWVRKYMQSQLSMSFRRQTTAAQKLPVDHEVQTMRAVQRVAFLCKQHSIGAERVINFDQTGLSYCPTSGQRTYEVSASKEATVVGAEDKRAITAVAGSTMSGELLPLQLIFGGKTSAVHPTAGVSSMLTGAGHHITHSDSHWSSRETMRQYMDAVVAPYVRQQSGTDAAG